MKRLGSTFGLLCLVGLLGGCNCHLAAVPGVFVQRRGQVLLQGRPLELCFVEPVKRRPVLLLFATGDGGWYGVSKAVFQEMADLGYPMVGIDSPAYLKTLQYETSATTTPRRLARDFKLILESAKQAMGLPEETPVVLVGLSRGAGFVVVAAGQTALHSELAGVVAIALTRNTDYVLHRRFWWRFRANRRASGRIRTYPYLRRLGELPVSVIQSTHDKYLPAEGARRLFGPDTESRRFYAVNAFDHSFQGGRASLFRDLEASLNWMLSARVR